MIVACTLYLELELHLGSDIDVNPNEPITSDEVIQQEFSQAAYIASFCAWVSEPSAGIVHSVTVWAVVFVMLQQ